MNDIWLLIGFVVIWFFIQGWLLPRLGVSTCMRPGCSVGDTKEKGNDFKD